MIYTELTKKAMIIAYNAHHGQLDKSGVPYIFHPYHIAEQMTDELTVCTALLHDTIEDTDITLDELSAEFPAEVINALKLLTRDDSVDYFDYVKALSADPIARAVKLADLRHNSDQSRLTDEQLENSAERMKKYRAAIEMLTKNE